MPVQANHAQRTHTAVTHGLVVAIVAAIVQAGYLAESSDDPTWATPIIDAATYHASAIRFADGRGLSDEPFWQPPLFPWLLGMIYRSVGVSVLAARCVLAAIAVGSCVLTWGMGRRLFDARIGILSGLALALYGPFLFYSTQLLPVGLAIFLTLAAIALWIEAIRRGPWPWWAACGLVSGLATITIPNAALLILLATGSAVLMGWRGPGRIHTLMAAVAVLVAGAIPITAVTARNYVAGGEWVVISTNGGMNFFLGNNPDRDRTIAIRPGEPWRRLAREAMAEGARTRPQQSRYFVRRSLDYVVSQPFDFFEGLGVKALRLLHARETPRNVDPYVHRDYSILLSVLMWRSGSFAFPSGVVAPLAVLGMIAALRTDRDDPRRPARTAVASFVFAYGGSVILFFVTARYRLPMVVAAVPLAAYGLRNAVDAIRTVVAGGSHRAWMTTMLLVAAVVIVNVPLRMPTDRIDFRAEMATAVADALAKRGRIDEAKEWLREVVRIHPDYELASVRLASLLAREGRTTDAERMLSRVVERHPDAVEARLLLGAVLYDRGQIDAARKHLEDALVIDATAPEVHAALANLLEDKGELDAAAEHLRIASRFSDEPAPLLIRLGDLLSARERYAEAIDAYRRGVWQMDEPKPAVLNRIAWLLATCPEVELRDCRVATELAEHLIDILGTSPEATGYRHAVALDTLAAAYAECGRFAEAVQASRRSVALAADSADGEVLAALRERLRAYEARLGAESQPSAAPPAP